MFDKTLAVFEALGSFSAFFHDVRGLRRMGSAALDLAYKAAQVPNAATEKEFDALKPHFSESEIVEIVAAIALFGYLNRWNDSMGSALEDLPIQAGEQHLQETGWEVGKHQ